MVKALHAGRRKSLECIVKTTNGEAAACIGRRCSEFSWEETGQERLEVGLRCCEKRKCTMQKVALDKGLPS